MSKVDNIQSVYPMTPMQEGMLFHFIMAPGSGAYCNLLEAELSGSLDPAVLEQSFNRLVAEYDILRTVFIHENMQRPRQVVLKERQLRIRYESLTEMEEAERESVLEALRHEQASAPFDLARDELMRIAVVQTVKDTYRLLWSHHHILMDGWGLGVLVQRLFDTYAELRVGRTVQAMPAPKYSTYIQWLEKQHKSAAAAYWKTCIDGYEQPVSLPKKTSEPRTAAYDKRECSFALGEEATKRLTALAAARRITLNTAVQAVWSILLSCYNAAEEVLFGSVVSGRPTQVPGIERMVGLFINTIPVRVQCRPELTFTGLLEQIQERALASEPFDYMPLYEIQSQSPLKHELLNHILIFENYPVAQGLMDESRAAELGFRVTDVRVEEQTNYDFNVIAAPGPDLLLKFSYNASLFDPDFVEKVGGHFTEVVSQVIADPEVRLRDLHIITEPEKDRLIRSFNDTEVRYPKDRTLHGLFEEQAARTPEEVCLLFDGKAWTYRAVNSRANRLARVLRMRGVGPEDRVAVMAERSPELIVGLLAVLKAGAAYVPCDPDYPEERIRYLLGDSEARLLLTRPHLKQRLAAGLQIEYEDLEEGDDFAIDDTDLPPACGAANLAYMIYTSGTTGLPKGVMIEHRSIANTVQWRREEYGFGAGDKVLLFLSFSFDAFVSTLFTPLISGAAVALAKDEEARDPLALKRTIAADGITHLSCVPSLFAAILESMSQEEAASLKAVTLGGEKVSGQVLAAGKKLNTSLRFYNEYGPTENSVISTVNDRLAPGSESNIGHPIANTQAFVVDMYGHLLPDGVPGELCVAGAGLARGYWKRDGLTAEKVVAHPIDAGKVMYRTGDRARWLPNGDLEFIERLDDQVKIRGYRIELGEVESVLLKHEKMKEAVVLAISDPRAAAGFEAAKVLCAYYRAAGTIDPAVLKTYMAQALPSYMVPAYWVPMETLPLTPNGKIDRRALPLPELAGDEAYEAPATETEEALAAIWQEVLKAARIGVNASFFELGGHSLKAMMLVSKIHKQLQAAVPLKVLFEQPTIREIAHYIDGVKGIVRYEPIRPAEERDYYPLSSAQRRMFVVSQLDKSGTSSNMPGAMMIEGRLPVERLRDAYRRLIMRHDSLRTSFGLVDGEPVQSVHPAVEAELPVREARPEELEAIARSFIRPFDLSKAPLIRVQLVQLEPEKSLLLFDLHHIIADGISMGIIVRELLQLMAEETPEPLSIQYKDYAEWQNRQLESEHMRNKESYWLNRFAGELPVLDLPADAPRPAVQTFEGDRYVFRSDKALTESLKELSRQTGTTLFMVLLAAYSVLLAKTAGQEDVTVGTPIAGRSHEDLQSVVGMFVGTLALRLRPTGDLTFRELLMQVKETTLEAYEHQEYPFETLVEKLDLTRDTSRNPLFDTMLILQNMDLQPFELGGWKAAPYELGAVSSKFDLTLEASETDEELEWCAVYRTRLFRKDTIVRWSERFQHVLRALAADPGQRLNAFDWLPEEEKRTLLDRFGNGGAKDVPPKTVHELMEEQAAAAPDRVALLFGDTAVTYGEWNAEANKLARLLREKGIREESRIGLIADRSLHMVTAILAIWKAGGAYVPIDPEYPGERIRYMLEDSGVRIVLFQNQDRLNERFASLQKELPEVEWMDLGSAAYEAMNDGNLPDTASPGHLAYMIYTSGTTGKPKGVMVEHRSISHNLRWRRDEYGFDERDTVLQLFSYAFDGCLTSLFTPLLGGGRVILLTDSEAKNPAKLKEWIEAREVTHFIAVPSLYLALLEVLTADGARSLRVVTLAGEKVSETVVQRSKRVLPHVELANEYGPTESSVVATVQRNLELKLPIAIGRPVSGTRVYIVNGQNGLQPIGTPGELCLAGRGLARGYWNKPEQHREKFVNDPFVPGEVMYRTGDLARWLADGTIEFLGRADHQVKVRGFRIELAEIESAILRQPGIREAVVLAREDRLGQSYLCAYVTADEVLQLLDVKAAVARALPGYMVPQYFIQLDRMPLTPNGKLDRQALPEPDRALPEPSYRAPSTETETLLAAVWQEVLGADRVGIADNFFELGGDSIKAIQVSARLMARGLQLEVKDLFQYPTIEKVSHAVVPAARRSSQEPVRGEGWLTPIQRWFFNRLFVNEHHWNQAVMLFHPEGFDAARIGEALAKIAVHHDALRTVFRSRTIDGLGSEPVPYVRGPEEGPLYTLERFDLTAETNASDLAHIVEGEANRIQRSFRLQEGPLLKAALFHTRDGDHLLLAAHHLVIDGVSWRILFEDLAAAYGQAAAGQEIRLPDKTDSFLEWASRLRTYADSKELQAEASYWKEQMISAEESVLPLPKDSTAPDNRRIHSATAELEFSEERTEQLLKQAHAAYQTETNDLLLCALGMAVQEWNGSGSVLVLLEGHGREELFEGLNITRTVGWFTCQYPVLLDMMHSANLPAQIKSLKEMLRRVPNKGIGYDLLRYAAPEALRSGMRTDREPEISFNYLGQFGTGAQSGGLQPSALDPGDSLSPDSDRGPALSFNGLIEGGRLKLRLEYNLHEFREASIQAFLDSYKRFLLDLIDHCLQKEEIERTPSDFSSKGMEQEEMDDIFELLQNKLG